VVLFRQGDVGEYLREVSTKHKKLGKYMDSISNNRTGRFFVHDIVMRLGIRFMSRIYRRLGNILGVRPGKVMLDLFS